MVTLLRQPYTDLCTWSVVGGRNHVISDWLSLAGYHVCHKKQCGRSLRFRCSIDNNQARLQCKITIFLHFGTEEHAEFEGHEGMSDTCSGDNCSEVNHNVIARTKPKPNPNPNPIPYPTLNLKVNHYEDVKPFLPEIIVTGAILSPGQMSDHPRIKKH